MGWLRYINEKIMSWKCRKTRRIKINRDTSSEWILTDFRQRKSNIVSSNKVIKFKKKSKSFRLHKFFNVAAATLLSKRQKFSIFVFGNFFDKLNPVVSNNKLSTGFYFNPFYHGDFYFEVLCLQVVPWTKACVLIAYLYLFSLN